jgi:glycosyltransferase involved in cell wall biosynthesis
MKKTEQNLNHLFIYNLSTDEENSVLAFTQDWINAFALKFGRVDVYSTHVGKFNTLGNVYVHETGGGNAWLRVRALFRLSKSSLRVLRNRKNSYVFHHMSVKTVIFPGVIYKIAHVPQVLWYSHSAVTPELKTATRIIDKVVTSVENAFPIQSSKVVHVGHGLKFNDSFENYSQSKTRSGIVYLGRITKIKNLEYLLEEMNRVEYRGTIDFIGPIADLYYKECLRAIASKGKYTLSFKSEIPHPRIFSTLSSYEFCYTGTPNSVDKATLEACASGCILITEMQPSIQLTGLDRAWKELSIQSGLRLGDQYLAIQQLKINEIEEIRRITVEATIAMNEVKSTVSKILNEIMTIK